MPVTRDRRDPPVPDIPGVRRARRADRLHPALDVEGGTPSRDACRQLGVSEGARVRLRVRHAAREPCGEPKSLQCYPRAIDPGEAE